MPRRPLAPWFMLAALLAAWLAPPWAMALDDAPAAAAEDGADAPPAAAPAAKAEDTEQPAPAENAGDAAKPAAAADNLEFVRLTDDGKGGGTLDTAIATYENADGVVVHLVAAVHVGERAYYEGLSETFDTYDALLYELVKPKDGPVPGAAAPVKPGGPRVRGAAALGGLQQVLKNALGLEFQLESINYDRPHFVHADLDVETFNKMQEDRGESLFRLMLRSIVNEMARQQEGKAAAQITVFDILAAMRSPDSTRQYKLLLARQMQDVEAQIQGMEGEEGTVIIAERNKAALRVLERTVGEGKRSIGVFYGAGHMRGIEDALVGDMGFRRTGVEWRVAWEMREAGAAGEDGAKEAEERE